MKLTEITSDVPLIITMFHKIKTSDDFGPYWVDKFGTGHTILGMNWVKNSKTKKYELAVLLSTQNNPRQKMLHWSEAGVDRLRLKKKLVPGQFAVDLPRWYLIDTDNN